MLHARFATDYWPSLRRVVEVRAVGDVTYVPRFGLSIGRKLECCLSGVVLVRCMLLVVMRRQQVAEAMLQAAASVNVRGETFITTPTDGGAYVVSAEPKFSEGAIRYPGDV